MSVRSVRNLVPGDPERIWRLAGAYNRMAGVCERLGLGLRATDVGGWHGRAAEAFHARFERQPRRFLAMADAYGHAAVALDTYAAALAWAQSQAGEVLAHEDDGRAPGRPAPAPAPTVTQQAELSGVIAGVDEPGPVRADERALALSTYRRALVQLDMIGNEATRAIMTAVELMPGPLPAPAAEPPSPAGSRVPPPPADLVVHAVIPQPPVWFDPAALRDDPRDWVAAIDGIRKRLRWDSLDRLSPRLAQHVFDGHYRPSIQAITGYHHREDGVDRGELRVVEIIDGPDWHGVYEAQVRGPRTPPGKVKKSTFFPDSWSRAEVLHAVRQVFLAAMRNQGDCYDPRKRRFVGEYRGVRICGLLARGPARPRLCDIVTAYPRGVRKPWHTP